MTKEKEKRYRPKGVSLIITQFLSSFLTKTEKREKVERERERNGFMEFNFNGDPIPGFRMEFQHMLGAFCISTGHSQFPAKKVTS